tara:strand:- start:1133 stop:1261 length:129 start_codon:yes stop_codon:yes gene_type:complete
MKTMMGSLNEQSTAIFEKLVKNKKMLQLKSISICKKPFSFFI